MSNTNINLDQENIELRKKAANDKLLAIENQVNILECKKVILLLVLYIFQTY